MSYLMKLFGLIFAAAGIALVAVAFVYPGRLDVYGIRLDTAANLLVGGVLALGLGGVIDALRSRGKSRDVEMSVPAAIAPAVVQEKKPELPANPFNRKPAVAAAATVVAAVADPVAETISALDHAKAEIAQSMSNMDSVVEPEHVHAEEAAEPEMVEGELYVVEEKVIRGRAARILSDETVEAETDEGWMRFENEEHLNEYLDSVEDQVG